MSTSSEAGTAVDPNRKNYAVDKPSPGEARFAKEKITFRVILLCILASMGGFIFGYDTGEISGLVAMPDFIARFGSNGGFSNVREGLIVSLLSVGSLVGALSGGPLANYPIVGRKGAIIVACIIFIIGTVIQIASITSWVQLMVGRFVAGLGVGQLSAVVPVYQAESAPKQIRGTLTATYQLFITFGILVAYLINFGTVKIDEGNSPSCWRITIGIGFIWPVFLILGMLFMPESPRFTLRCGNEERCRRDMVKIRGVPADDVALNYDIAEMKEAMAIDSKLPHGLGEIFRGKPKVFYRVLLGFSLQMFQQLTGANYFFYYGTTIFQSIGSPKNPYVTSIILGAVNFGCTFGGLYVVEKFGRRKALILGGIGMAASFLVFASVGFKLVVPGSQDAHGQGTPTKTAGYVMVIFGCLFILSYATTWAPVVWTVNSEMMPSRVRALAVGICTSGNWSWNFLLSFFTPFITNDIGFKYGYVFAACSLAGAVVVYFFLYETRGLTLEQIDEMYGTEGLKPWKSSSWEPTDHEILYKQRQELLSETDRYKRDQHGAGEEQHLDYVERSRRGDGNEESVAGFRSMA
ncbi:putative MFS monosaccharide transporter [Taphrina deformans PYCC 5710]|uniref:MFS monosaccharide transporter n=1 Tax=Taphrina deformans (strain PYCC 5710 / ATCC 11124 / CBS 356.35 / IMI 108563 / JCM 9778 / NBRC 8474) TaxID=1097556 RepID=R4XBZ2_TAPDE|nr:putative MFS monosaccharide transporter [Taphrina deformans PYCC 5710]|eukprot:CCG80860.1 putative MFS monosaccharide transporter [Taphrina deformans PYCC 5710]